MMIWRAIVLSELLLLDLGALGWAFAMGPPEGHPDLPGSLVIPVLVGMVGLMVGIVLLLIQIGDDVAAWRAERRKPKPADIKYG